MLPAAAAASAAAAAAAAAAASVPLFSTFSHFQNQYRVLILVLNDK